MSRWETELDHAVVTETEKKLKKPPLYKVLLHNDDYTTKEFVVQILQYVFHKEHTAAVQIMLLVHCGGDIARLKEELEGFFTTYLEPLPQGKEREPQQTLGFHRVLQRAVIHAQSAEKKEINGGNLLAAIFREPDSYAAYLLEKHGIARFDVINYISHGVSKLSTGEEWSTSSEEEGDEERP